MINREPARTVSSEKRNETNDSLCQIQFCDRPRRESNGLCHMHDARVRRFGTHELTTNFSLAPLERFIRNIRFSETCWLWVGARSSTGYGLLGVSRKLVGAHRFSYMTWNGKLEPGRMIHHECHVRACVNPSHLKQVTSKENRVT